MCVLCGDDLGKRIDSTIQFSHRPLVIMPGGEGHSVIGVE